MNLFFVSLFIFHSMMHFQVVLVNAKCNAGQFDCQSYNGQCIDLDKLCDGNIDCGNGFDEESLSCNNIICPKYSFKCAYGACIDKNLKCDGNIDCHDRSDESSCSNLSKTTDCLKTQFQCKNSECISIDFICDGKINCKDASDETIELCGNIRCPMFSFQCEYGACIPQILKCNGIYDCIDKTDEKGCSESNMISIVETTTLNSLQQSPIAAVLPRKDIPSIGCSVPFIDMLILTDVSTEVPLTSGTKAFMGTFVNYSCPRKTYLKGQYKTNFCGGLNWINPHPQCIKMCPPIKGHTINVLCTKEGNGVDCRKPVEPGTSAKISCGVMYKKPQRFVHEDLYCQDDGEWNHSSFKCEQTCGTINTNIPYSVQSEITQVFKVPWLVAIYSKIETGLYKHICGGTLIESKIVITAAHCFWNSKNESLLDKSNYAVAVGKFYSDFYATNETEPVQVSNISKIDIPRQFRGGHYDYVSDIAVLTLNDHIEYKNHIRPACLTWKANNEKPIPSGKPGIVAGWGITDTGDYSPDLRSVDLLSIDSRTCEETRITKNDRIANDKFCVATNEGKNVCKGDSGGGFLVPEEINDISYYHLWGVVSNGITSRNAGDECNANFVTTFTNVQWYEHFVNDAIENINSVV